MTRPTTRLAAATALMVAWTPGVQGQGTTLGTFRWQLQPYCNTVVVTVTQQGGIYTVDGFDDQCGAPQRAPLVGLATPNPDGPIGLGLHVVTVPGGRGLDIAARISLATLGGPWTDSAGNTGTFAFNGAGAVRPAPTIPAAMIAPGSIGLTAINASEVQARVSGGCTNGQAFRGVHIDGSVTCTDVQTTVDAPVTDVGFFTSIVVPSDGRPLVTHVNITSGSARATKCGIAACTAGNATVAITTPPSHTLDSFTRVAIGADGLPLVAVGDATFRTISVVSCGNGGCTTGNAIATLDDSAASAGYYPSLRIGIDGLPIISHQDTTARALRIVKCGTTANRALSGSGVRPAISS